MRALTIGEASRRSGWSPRMLRYLEQEGLVVPARSDVGYRRYGIRELNQLNALRELRRRALYIKVPHNRGCEYEPDAGGAGGR